jgi:hypothetical protein
MASEKQISANQRNAAKSTGPVTQTGKQNSRGNAIRHGLAATTVVPAFEDAEEFERFEMAIKAEYQPTSTIEHELLARLVSLLWRLRRATSIETNLFKRQARLATERKSESDTTSERMELFYRLLQGPDNSTPPKSKDCEVGLTITPMRDPGRPDPATVFLRLCNLSSSPIERINRYEIALWRQLTQTLFILNGCRGPAKPI